MPDRERREGHPAGSHEGDGFRSCLKAEQIDNDHICKPQQRGEETRPELARGSQLHPASQEQVVQRRVTLSRRFSDYPPLGPRRQAEGIRLAYTDALWTQIVGATSNIARPK